MNVIAKSALVNFWSSLPKGAPREDCGSRDDGMVHHRIEGELEQL